MVWYVVSYNLHVCGFRWQFTVFSFLFGLFKALYSFFTFLALGWCVWYEFFVSEILTTSAKITATECRQPSITRTKSSLRFRLVFTATEVSYTIHKLLYCRIIPVQLFSFHAIVVIVVVVAAVAVFISLLFLIFIVFSACFFVCFSCQTNFYLDVRCRNGTCSC